MNVSNPKQHPPAPHLGPMPADPKLQAEIQQANAAGWPTIMSSTWQAMKARGIEPDHLLELA